MAQLERPIRVAVFGAGGQMGISVCKAVVADPALKLTKALDPRLAGIDLGHATSILDTGIVIDGQREAITHGEVDVAIDFTEASGCFENALYCASAGIHMVIGTTGLSDLQINELERAFSSSEANCLIAPNFAIGAILMMKFSEMAARFFESAEVIELHHNRKVDAPSGTALATAERITGAKGVHFDPDPTKKELDGARGHKYQGGVNIHSLRIAGMVAHQEVIFGTTGQTLTLRHDSYDRTSFMPGVILAVKGIFDLDGLVVGLDSIVDGLLE
ncbi:MAG: 4-hydroxy-tetrahydrodipicolinate reductase [Actinomycetota bacterium]|nr:4-hydroxy-tetrahydrodipicolinate reductase [Actinomycetota bacterium]